MEPVVFGLVFFALVLFMLSLYLMFGATPAAAPGKKVLDTAGDRLKVEEQKFIVVKLPESCLAPENYTLDLRVSLHRGSDKPVGGKPDKNRRWYKNQYHELDEYM